MALEARILRALNNGTMVQTNHDLIFKIEVDTKGTSEEEQGNNQEVVEEGITITVRSNFFFE